MSPWFRISELVVSNEGVLRQNTTDGMFWSDIVDIEAKNFSGGKTLGVVAISAAVVLVVIAAIAGADGGGGGRGSVKPAGGGNGGLGGWNTKGGSGGSTGGSAGGGGGTSSGGNFGGGIHVHPHPNYYSGGPNYQPPPRPDVQLLGAANFAIPDPTLAAPMFQEETERKAKAHVVAAVEATSVGDAFNPAAAPSMSAAAVVRLGNVVEIGGGFRQMFPTQLSGPEGLGFFRFGLNLNLDQRHLFAVPIGFDMGTSFGNDAILYKVNAGLRLNITPNVAVGAYPLNPTYFENTTGFGWGFPSSAELSFSF